MKKQQLAQTLGRNVWRLRKRRGMTQAKLAELVDVTPAFLSRVEQGEKLVSLEVLSGLKESLDVTYDALLCEQEPGSAGQSVCAALENCPEAFVDALERFVRESSACM